MGVAILAALLTCMGARFNAARVKRMFPPAGSPAKGKGSSSPTATTSTEDLEDGLQTPRVLLLNFSLLKVGRLLKEERDLYAACKTQ